MNLDMSWGDMARAAGGRLVHGDSEDRINSLSTDSRSVKNGQCFLALKGQRFDAHNFLNQELASKVAGWILEAGHVSEKSPKPPHLIEVANTLKALQAIAAQHRRRFDIPVVGITGSNGKTTTKEMLKSICRRVAPVCASPGNWNNHIGVPLSVLELTAEHRYGIFELADSKPGDIAEVARIAGPTIAIITNIGPDHMEFYENLEKNFQTKSELLEALPEDGKAVINIDDPWLDGLESRLGERAVTFGMNPRARVRFESESEMIIDRHKINLKLQAFGALSRYNACAAAAAALALGISEDAIRQGLEDFRPSAMRLERLAHASGCEIVLDAYNANPASMRAAIEAFCQEFAGRAKVLILGDMKELGGDSKRFHQELGQWLAVLPLKSVYLAGPEMAWAYEALKSAAAFPVNYGAASADLSQPLRKEFAPGQALFFKASRAMKFESLLDPALCSTH